MNYPRLNEFPEWFTVVPDGTYAVHQRGCEENELSSAELRLGLNVVLTADVLSKELIIQHR